MCGRFTYRLTWREIVALYRLTAPASPERNLQARYNICPTTTIDAVVQRGDASLIERIQTDPMPTGEPEALIAWGERNIQSE